MPAAKPTKPDRRCSSLQESPCARFAWRYCRGCSRAQTTRRMKIRRRYILTGLSVFTLYVGALGSLQAQSLQFTRVQRLTNSEIALALTAAVGSAYRIESSTNGADWNGYVTFATNVTTSLQNTDSAAPYPCRRATIAPCNWPDRISSRVNISPPRMATSSFSRVITLHL